jgi:hypothetical protein
MDKILKQNIIKDLGFDKLPPKDQEEALLSAGRVIFQAVLIRVLEILDEKKKEEFEKIIAESPDDQEKIMKFLNSKIPDLEQISREEIANFKKECLNLLKAR